MENITEGNDKNEIINFVNSNDQPINSNNLNKKTYEKVVGDDGYAVGGRFSLADVVLYSRYDHLFLLLFLLKIVFFIVLNQSN